MIYLGENQINGVKLGDNNIPAIYVGTNCIYPINIICNNCISISASANQTIIPPTGKAFEYSFDKYIWKEMTTSISFGSNGKKVIYVRGKNSGGINGSFVFSENTPITLSGNCMSLLDWENDTLDTVPSNGFSSLFSDVTVLKSVSKGFLPAINLSDFCYSQMFDGCTSLINMPDLPAEVMAVSCYQNMFRDCSSLTNLSVLTSTTLADSCYCQMFDGCSSIKIAPLLPATTLAQSCYNGMFFNCTGLTKIYSLPATTLLFQCYAYMFYGCTSLNEIHCDATDIGTSYYRSLWVNGVPSTGNFYGKSVANWPDGMDGIPNGWNKYLD